MYYAHPLISYPSSVKVLSESPVKRKRSDCNKAVLTLLISLYGAFHLAAAGLALFLIQVNWRQSGRAGHLPGCRGRQIKF